MKIFFCRLLVLLFTLIGITSCNKKDLFVSSGKCVINGENYTYESSLTKFLAIDTHDASIFNWNNKFVFQTDMSFLPTSKKSDSPNYQISFTLNEVEDFVIGKKYDIPLYQGEEGYNNMYETHCYFKHYRYADNIIFDEFDKCGTGSIEFINIHKMDELVEGIFEFEVSATDDFEKWTAKGNFKLYTNFHEP